MNSSQWWKLAVDKLSHLSLHSARQKQGKTMTPDSAWQRIKVAQLAEDLNISRTAIYKWQKSERGIPAERAIEVEGITAIDRQNLRPDLWPSE